MYLYEGTGLPLSLKMYPMFALPVLYPHPPHALFLVSPCAIIGGGGGGESSEKLLISLFQFFVEVR